MRLEKNEMGQPNTRGGEKGKQSMISLSLNPQK